jgi:hypothetical protein
LLKLANAKNKPVIYANFYKKFNINKNTLLQNLPKELVNEFLDFLGPVGQHRIMTLQLINEGRIIFRCRED